MRYMHAIALLIFTAGTFVLPCIAAGAEEAAHGGEWKEWLWRILNFAVLVFILVKFLNKPLRNFLRQRTELIEKTLREAQEAKALAVKALEEVEERLRMKDREIADILSQASEAAAREQDHLLQSGEQMREKVLEQARHNIEHELRLAKEAIRAEAAGIALELAERKLRERLTGEEQTRLMEESIRKMETRK